MTKTFCNICEKELGRYDQWFITYAHSNMGYPDRHGIGSGSICRECALPAVELVVAATEKEVAA